MGLFDFVKDAGSALFGGDDDKQAAPQRDLDDVLADKETARRLTAVAGRMGLGVDDLSIKFRAGKATLAGHARSLADREKLVLLVGNTQGVAQVEDLLTLETPAARAAEAAPEESASTMYTVQRGDTLSKIAKAHYGNAMKYTVIFEANRPMLDNPDRIYPGQVLRIPPLAD